MMEDGFQPQQLFTDLALAGEERAALLRAVVKAEPAFSPPPQAPSPANTSTLLREIYAKVSPRHEAAVTVSFLFLCLGKTRLQAQASLVPSQMSFLWVLSWTFSVMEPHTVWPFVPGSLMTILKVPLYCGVCWSLVPLHG